ncbi:sensor histidine kinase [Solilutibacter silvestris]|uniref:Signal transduction histidine kinase n=1 Tax=Solilutibacter silvestris TaxID=1645665 RepID=A0A2K1Q2C0_9GAMM|nr:sensor histidine kinase [Lysobacter silvestris]PNS09131.1 Signal transduction histidine kinase [Lysobacter silvestris]
MQALRAMFTPAPDSLVARDLARGHPLWSHAIQLLWSSWIFIIPIFEDHGYTFRWLVLTLASYPVFLFLYAKCCTGTPRAAGWYAVAMLAMCLVLMPWYPGGLSYFVFGCIMLSCGLMRPIQYGLALLFFNTLCIAEGRWLHYPWSALAWLPITTVIIGILVQFERSNARKNAELALSHAEVKRIAAFAERERIGRDLHDLLGHTLSIIALKSELAGKLVERDPHTARREIDDVARIARETLSEVRATVSGMRNAVLLAELASARVLLGADNIHMVATMDEIALKPDAESALAMSLREAITNVQRHAGARHVEVRLQRNDDGVAMEISDDGRGGTLRAGNGLTGMRERLEAHGGSLELPGNSGRSERGTTLVARLPARCLA